MSSAALTVIAVSPRVGGHGAVAGEVLPLLNAHAHVGTRVLLAGGARTCQGEKGGGEAHTDAPLGSDKGHYRALKGAGTMQQNALLREISTQHGPGKKNNRGKQRHHPNR